MTRGQLEMILISGICKGMVELLLMILEEKIGSVLEVGQSLWSLLCDLIEKKMLDTMKKL